MRDVNSRPTSLFKSCSRKRTQAIVRTLLIFSSFHAARILKIMSSTYQCAIGRPSFVPKLQISDVAVPHAIGRARARLPDTPRHVYLRKPHVMCHAHSGHGTNTGIGTLAKYVRTHPRTRDTCTFPKKKLARVRTPKSPASPLCPRCCWLLLRAR